MLINILLVSCLEIVDKLANKFNLRKTEQLINTYSTSYPQSYPQAKAFHLLNKKDLSTKISLLIVIINYK